MRVVQVIAGAEMGGAETFAQDAILSLHAHGVAQTVITRPWPTALARYAQAGIPVRTMGFSTTDRLLRRGRMIRDAAQGADLVHAWMSRANAFIPAGMPCPVLGWFGDYYDLKYFPRSDSFVGVTPDIHAYLLKQGLPAERCHMVNTFGTMPEAPAVDRTTLGAPPGTLALLVLARMHRVKGIDTMLHAMMDLPGAVLWLAGEGPARGEYEALATRLGLSDRVRFLGWRNDRRALIEACDVVVLPSRYEPFGTVIVEAWAMRRPLVATLADGARQYVTDGVTGLTCAIEDAAGLAACLRRLQDDPGLRARLAEAGEAAYRADFTREVVTDRLMACYGRAIDLGTWTR
jgi:glycosyltransferase involved in cell wall biosynthesis